MSHLGHAPINNVALSDRENAPEFMGLRRQPGLPGQLRVESREKIPAKIVSAARDAFELPNVKLNVSVSIGVAVTKNAVDADRLLARADEALYETKRAGRNGFKVAKDA